MSEYEMILIELELQITQTTVLERPHAHSVIIFRASLPKEARFYYITFRTAVSIKSLAYCRCKNSINGGMGLPSALPKPW